MQQLTQAKPSAALSNILLQLRQSMAGADSIATCTPELPTALAETLKSIPETQRNSVLLHALDEAIAAIELAARLADALTVQHNGADRVPPAQQALQAAESGNQSNQKRNTIEDPLFAAYRAFAESQPLYQDIYHYRNALAERLRTARDANGLEA